MIFAMEYQCPDPHIEKKGLFFMCNLCTSFLNSTSQVQSHIVGSNHKKQMNMMKHVQPQAEVNIYYTQQQLSAFNLTADGLPKHIEKHGYGYRCICCEMQLNSNSQITSHVSGAKHIKKATSFTGLSVKIEAVPLIKEKSLKITPMSNSGSTLPPYIEKLKDQYRCVCCNSMLNSYSQISSHVSGTKHQKAKLFYEDNPSLSLVKSDCENVREDMEESMDLYSAFVETDEEELMRNVKIIRAEEDIVF